MIGVQGEGIVKTGDGQEVPPTGLEGTGSGKEGEGKGVAPATRRRLRNPAPSAQERIPKGACPAVGSINTVNEVAMDI